MNWASNLEKNVEALTYHVDDLLLKSVRFTALFWRDINTLCFVVTVDLHVRFLLYNTVNCNIDEVAHSKNLSFFVGTSITQRHR